MPETFFHADTKPLQVTLPTAEHFKWNLMAVKLGVTLLLSVLGVMDYLSIRLVSNFSSVSMLQHSGLQIKSRKRRGKSHSL